MGKPIEITMPSVADMEKMFGKHQESPQASQPGLQVGEYVRLARAMGAQVVAIENVQETTEGRCCSRAVRNLCVCRVSWRCPGHGTTCIGSHD